MAVGIPFHLALLLLLGTTTVRRADSTCTTPNPSDYESANMTNEVLWWCKDATKTFSDLDRVKKSDCDNATQLDDSHTCTPPSSTITCDSSAPAFSTPENATLVTSPSLPDYVKYFTCQNGLSWLSGSPGAFTQCKSNTWSPIFDICENSCAVPRDCSMVAEMGFNQTDLFRVIPTGIIHGEQITVQCFLTEDDGIGWTLIMHHMKALPTPMPEGGSGQTPANNFTGIRHLASLNWDGNTPRPLVFQFILTVTENSQDKTYHATYDGVQMLGTPPWTLTDVGNYHGNAGNAFQYNKGKDFKTGGVWWENATAEGALKITINQIFWETLPKGSVVKTMILRVRPQAYDRNQSCPPLIGVEPAWREKTYSAIPMNRGRGAVISYNCTDPMWMEGPKDALEQNKTHSGNITCDAVPGGASLNWTRVPVLPCTLTCPVTYVRNADESFCLRFSEQPAEYGIASASLNCSAQDNASLAVINMDGDLRVAKNNIFYYTTHVWIDGNTVPTAPIATNISCDATAGCQLNDTLRCLSVGKTTSALQKAQSCQTQDTHYVCRFPAFCPVGFTEHKGLCYQVISSSSWNDVFLNALLDCRKKGSVLAYPESADTLQFIATLVRKQLAAGTANASVILGLHNADDSWTGGGVYEPDSTIVAMANVTSQNNEIYRFLQVPASPTANISLHASAIKATGGITFNYAVCQLHGQEGCRAPPPEANENMTMEWNNSTVLGTNVKYTCYPGYFMNESITLKEQSLTCYGQLGDWNSIDNEIYNCSMLEVCRLEEIPCTGNMFTEITPSDNFLALNGTLTYRCPPGMNMNLPNNTVVNEMNVTCSYDASGGKYGFVPSNITDCNVCANEPNVPHANSTWVNSTTYTVGMNVTFTCEPGYLMEIKNNLINTTAVTCKYLGWNDVNKDKDLTCFKACLVPLPEAGENMTKRDLGHRRVRQYVKYICDNGTFIPAAYPNEVNSTKLTCDDDGTWKSPFNESDLYCTELCFDDPPTALAPGNTTWDNKTRVVGTKVNLTCPEGYAFPDYNTTIPISCEADRQWTSVDSGSLLCRRITYTKPAKPNKTVDANPNGPFWEGTTLNYTCPNNTMSTSGEEETSFTFNGTEWVPLDPEFACFNVCGTPPALELVVNGTNSTSYPEGKQLLYECLAGFVDNSTNLTATCGGSKWSPEIIPRCLMCVEEPPAAPALVTQVWDHIASYGKNVSYVCRGKFPNGKSVINVTCVNGNWSSESIPPCTGTTPGPSTLPPIVLPTQPPYDVSYPATSDYYWGTLQNNMSDANAVTNNYGTTNGPFGFGYAVKIASSKKQCMIQDKYQYTGDTCTVNPKYCTDGLSISVWEKAIMSLDFFNESREFTAADHKYVLSTGGDEEGHPGIAIYHKGFWLGAVVSTGDKFWKLEVAGPMVNDTWSNIALRWETPRLELVAGKPTEKTGGLELWVNLQKVGHQVEGRTPPAQKQPLDPSLMMVGCHKTQENQTFRGYNDAEYDELAMWTRKLWDNETLFFFGGYERNFSNVDAEVFMKTLERVDLTDPDQQAAAVSIATKLTQEEPTPTVPPAPTSSTGTSSSSSAPTSQTLTSPTATSPTATGAPPSLGDVKKFADRVAIVDTLTDPSNLPKPLTPSSLRRMMDIVEPVSNIFLPSTYDKWRELQKNKTEATPLKIVTNLEQLLMNYGRALKFSNTSEPVYATKAADHIVAQVAKETVDDFKAKWNFYEFPNYNELPGIRSKWHLPYDRVAIPTDLFSDDRCNERSLNIVSLLYDTYDNIALTKVNPANFKDKFKHEIDARVLTVRAECDPQLDEFGKVDPSSPPCVPEHEKLKNNPVRFKLEHNTKTVALRKLQFHQNEVVSEINKRFCAWFNPAIGDNGAWDQSDCKVMESTTEYTKCACGHFGTFTVIAEKVEERVVPEEKLWLTITKYVGYILSFIALIFYIGVIAVSGDLKEQFHLIGLNLSVAVFMGSIFMLVSDMSTVRSDRHTCTAIGSLIHIFYSAAGAWILVLGHASFKAITSGIVSGRLRAYWFLAWSLPLITMGLQYLLFLHDLGLDPRCFISWENNPKWIFFGPQLFCCAVAFVFGTIVLCNMSTPALRKDNLIDDYGSFCHGASFVLIFFTVTWLLGFMAYIRFDFKEPNFYPIFQVFNSWTGLIIFLFIGIGSKRFRMILAGQAKLRREILFGNAFGTPTVPVDDKEHLRVPEDQRSNSSGRSSPVSPSGVNLARPSSMGNDLPSRSAAKSQVAGRPGSRPNSGF